MDKDYLRGYADGLADAEASAAYAERLRAFGAIRRAVEVARSCDRFADSCGSNKSFGCNIASSQKWCAEAIRNSIRAAIGSHKT